MHKKILLVLLTISLLVIFGCKQQQEGSGPFIGGIKGIDAGFSPNAPPSQFNEDQEVPVKITLVNNGEFNVDSGLVEVQLFGVNRPIFGLNDQYKPTEGVLYGVDQFNTQGGEQQVDFGVMKYTQKISNEEDFNLKAKVCYPYTTYAQIKACVSSVSIEEGKGDQVCTIEGEKVVKGSVSSGPIQVTSFKQEFRGADIVLFNMNIENKGIGKVYKEDSICSDLDDAIKRADSENIIHVKIIPEDVKCRFLGATSSEGDIRLDNGIKLLTCQQAVQGTGSNFEEKVAIELSYKYIDSASKSFKIFQTNV